MDFVRPIEAIVPGAQGRVLAVLAETTAELNLRTLARLSGVSMAQASRVLPSLVELGIIARREVPPSSLFRLVPEHVAARAILDLAKAAGTVFQELGELASRMPVPPASVIAFGSFARGEARADSDIDVVLVRPPGVDEDNDAWAASVEQWRTHARQLTGNVIEVLEVSIDDAASALADGSPLWTAIQAEGRLVHGAGLDELQGARAG